MAYCLQQHIAYSNREWTAKADQLLLLICSKERFGEQQIMSVVSWVFMFQGFVS